MERQRRAVMAARLMLIEGVIQRSKEGVVHLMATRVIDRSAMLDLLSADRRAEPPPCPGDIAAANPQEPNRHRHPRNVPGVLPRSRDFHSRQTRRQTISPFQG